MNLRIAIITRSLPTPGTGGMERVVADLIHAWQRAGASITVVSAESSPDAHSLLPVPVIVVPGNSRRTTARWTRDVSRSVDWTLFDVILGVSAAARSIARLRDRPPVIMQAHGTSLDEIRTKFRVRSPRAFATVGRNFIWAFRDFADARKYDAVVAVGPGIAATLSRYPSIMRPRLVQVICNGVPANERISATTDQVDYDYLYVGRLHREKGVDLLIRAVRRSDLRVAIVGDGPQRDHLHRLAKGASNVSFLGRRTPDEVSKLRTLARAAVMPSRRLEGLPLAALESLSAGRPVLASNGVTKAFADELPHGVVSLPLGRRAMRLRLSERVNVDAVELPIDYWASTASMRYLQLFDRLIEQ